MVKKIRIALFLVLSVGSCFASESAIVVPPKPLIEWQEAELGVILHLDMYTFKPDYQWRKWGTHPSPSIFNPTLLDTDQWVQAIKGMGARYAVLVAKHCTGFSLWPTKAHDYNISKSPYKNGKGDIVREFVNSCRKYGIKPGIYASTTANGYFWVDNPGKIQKGSPITQSEYNRIVDTQLTELWTQYGKLFEVWFDGGVLPKREGGANVLEILEKYQPEAIALEGPHDHACFVRWGGTEKGGVPYPCWATAKKDRRQGGNLRPFGNPYAKSWRPAESDCTLRSHEKSFRCGWFWHRDQEHLIYPLSHLVDIYRRSVGRNANMLIGIVIDDRGLIPDADVRRMAEFGKKIEELYGKPVKCVSGESESLSFSFKKPVTIDRLILQEEIAYGERILAYTVQGLTPAGKWQRIASGSCVGHKKIDHFRPITVKAVKLEIPFCKATPRIRTFSVFEHAATGGR